MCNNCTIFVWENTGGIVIIDRNKKTSGIGGFVPKERFELSRARCPLRPERSASASSATSASELLFYRKGVICQIKTGIKPELKPEVAALIFFGMKTVTFSINEKH